MKVYRIRHIPTGLYWQKARVGSNTLSKKGKVYLNKGTAERVLSDYVREIHLSRRSAYYDKLLEMAEDGPYIFTGDRIVGIPRKDWEVVEFNLIENK